VFLLAALNKMKLWMGDVTNAYPRAKAREQVYFIAGREFGPKEGCVVVIVMALYGLKTSGAAWHSYLADNLRALGYHMCIADNDVWMRLVHEEGKEKYYEYLIVYVDDICAATHRPELVFMELQQRFEMKGVGPPKRYLGANVESIRIGDQEYLSLSSWQYLKEVIQNVENTIGYPLKRKKVSTPTAPIFHPELDESDPLDDRDTAFYQSLIGTLQWLVELGRIDIHYVTSRMARFSAAPRRNHLTLVMRIFAYLKCHLEYCIVFDSMPRKWKNKKWAQHDWIDQYPDANEQVPLNMITPLGKSVQINFWCDASFANDLRNRHSHTGIVIFLNNTPIRWYSKCQSTCESSAYGAELVALKIAGELVEGLRYKLRMMGVPIDGPANGFCDNAAVVLNTTIPSSSLKKKHNSIAFHRTRELVACGVIRITKEPGEFNLADLLTKGLTGPRHEALVACILH
jgi:hypothetical protein